ncbi:MAG: GntR family transcriptional regulator [Oscillospiraceae bacterium]|nr:GntR family transcriptional regulator [Oscillospiraceae bacterium]
MDWIFRQDAPIYSQIIEGFKLSIASGELKPGEKLRSVRELAAWAGVNPNTMQRALSELEREGLVYAQRTSGRYVTEEENSVARVRRQLASERLSEFTAFMNRLGYAGEDIIGFIKEGEKPNGNS